MISHPVDLPFPPGNRIIRVRLARKLVLSENASVPLNSLSILQASMKLSEFELKA